MINTMKSEKPWYCYGIFMIGRNSMNFQISTTIYSCNCEIFIVQRKMALFIPASVDQNLLPPSQTIEVQEKPVHVSESSVLLSYANIPFQQQVLLMPSMNAMRYDSNNRMARIFAVVNYYNAIPQPPGTIILFQDWVSFTYGARAQACEI